MARVLPILAALALILAACWPVFDVGFLADDYHLGREIHHAAEVSPGFTGAVSSAFARRWSEDFDVFRPLTILTVQADYALFGVDGRRHHVTNLALWMICALLFASVVARIRGGVAPWERAALVALFGVYPAAVESLAWLVAREDTLTTLFALLTVRVYLARPDRPLLWVLAMIPAFLAKETAVVIPPLLFWLELCGFGRGRAEVLGTRVRRHVAPACVLAAYFGARYLAFGRVGMTYSGRGYTDRLLEDGALSRIAESLTAAFEKITVPLNTPRLEAWAPDLSPMVVALAFLVPLAAILILGMRTFGERPALIALALGWMLGPLLLVSPILRVGPGLSVGRTLFLPCAAWLLLVGCAFCQLLQRRPRTGAALAAALIVVAGCTMRLNLGAWTAATGRAESLIADLGEIGPDESIIFVGVEDRMSGAPLHPALMIHQGAWVLSLGIIHAMEAPYRASDARSPRIVTWKDVVDSDGACLGGDEFPQPRLVALRFEADRPRFIVLNPKSTWREKRFRAFVTDFNPTAPVFILLPRIGREPRPPTRLVIVSDLEGNRAVAEVPPESNQVDGASFSPALTPELLSALPSPAALYWEETRHADGLVETSTFWPWLIRKP